MVLHDVAYRSHFFIKAPASLNAEVFGHRDLQERSLCKLNHRSRQKRQAHRSARLPSRETLFTTPHGRFYRIWRRDDVPGILRLLTVPPPVKKISSVPSQRFISNWRVSWPPQRHKDTNETRKYQDTRALSTGIRRR